MHRLLRALPRNKPMSMTERPDTDAFVPVEEMVTKFDDNRDGEISLGEFVQHLREMPQLRRAIELNVDPATGKIKTYKSLEVQLEELEAKVRWHASRAWACRMGARGRKERGQGRWGCAAATPLLHNTDPHQNGGHCGAGVCPLGVVVRTARWGVVIGRSLPLDLSFSWAGLVQAAPLEARAAAAALAAAGEGEGQGGDGGTSGGLSAGESSSLVNLRAEIARIREVGGNAPPPPLPEQPNRASECPQQL